MKDVLVVLGAVSSIYCTYFTYKDQHYTQIHGFPVLSGLFVYGGSGKEGYDILSWNNTDPLACEWQKEVKAKSQAVPQFTDLINLMGKQIRFTRKDKKYYSLVFFDCEISQ